MATGRPISLSRNRFRPFRHGEQKTTTKVRRCDWCIRVWAHALILQVAGRPGESLCNFAASNADAERDACAVQAVHLWKRQRFC